MKIVVLDSDTLGCDLDLSPLEKLGELKIYPSLAPGMTRECVRGCDVVIVNKVRVNEETMGEDPAFGLVCVFATGYDNIDLDYCRAHDIAVCNVVGYSTDSVAQLTLSMALSLYTRLGEYNRHVTSGTYTASGVANLLAPVYHEIAGKTWGVAGYGNIGKAVGRAARALGCEVIAYKRTPTDDVRTVDLDTLLRESDILSVHLPLSEATRGLFGAKEIEKMKKEAVFINMARGAVIDEAAFAGAVKKGRIAGFGCDVYTKEPFGVEHPYTSIMGFDNVILTPHMAWGAYEARVRCLEEICENIKSFYAGGTRCRVDK